MFCYFDKTKLCLCGNRNELVDKDVKIARLERQIV